MMFVTMNYFQLFQCSTEKTQCTGIVSIPKKDTPSSTVRWPRGEKSNNLHAKIYLKFIFKVKLFFIQQPNTHVLQPLYNTRICSFAIGNWTKPFYLEFSQVD